VAVFCTTGSAVQTPRSETWRRVSSHTSTPKTSSQADHRVLKASGATEKTQRLAGAVRGIERRVARLVRCIRRFLSTRTCSSSRMERQAGSWRSIMIDLQRQASSADLSVIGCCCFLAFVMLTSASEVLLGASLFLKRTLHTLKSFVKYSLCC
jgi:hypothetical protein